MHARARPPAAALYGALLAHTLISAANYLFAKRALMEIPALPLGMLRFAGASLLMLVLLRRVRPPGQRMPPRTFWRRLLLLALLGVPVNQGLFLSGLQLSTAAHAALLYTMTPLFVLLLAQALIGEFPGWRTALGTALALGGTLLVLFQRGLDLSGGPLIGDLLLLVAVIAWAAYTAEGREVVGKLGAFPTIAWTLIAGTLVETTKEAAPPSTAMSAPDAIAEANRHTNGAKCLVMIFLSKTPLPMQDSCHSEASR